MKKHHQVAALPARRRPDGLLEVLLVTSRNTGRWVIPKGWPMAGLMDCEAARQEALEEAGVTGKVDRDIVGTFPYWKRMEDHFSFVEVDVYMLKVKKLKRDWREKSQRTRKWMLLEEAAEVVVEPGLIAIFQELIARESRRQSSSVREAPASAN